MGRSKTYYIISIHWWARFSARFSDDCRFKRAMSQNRFSQGSLLFANYCCPNIKVLSVTLMQVNSDTLTTLLGFMSCWLFISYHTVYILNLYISTSRWRPWCQLCSEFSVGRFNRKIQRQQRYNFAITELFNHDCNIQT